MEKLKMLMQVESTNEKSHLKRPFLSLKDYLYKSNHKVSN